MSNQKRFTDITEASAISGVTPRALRLAIDRGDFQAFRLEKRILIDIASMMEWIESLPAVKQAPVVRQMQEA